MTTAQNADEIPHWQLCVRIGQTAYGKGLFARRKFRRGQVVGRVLGKTIDIPNYDSNYCIDLGGQRRLEPAAPFRFLNHCCEPNCRFIWFDQTGKSRRESREELWVESTRIIEPGEQLTIDYGWPADNAIPCGCRRPSCRGWVVDASELPHLLARLGANDLAG